MADKIEDSRFRSLDNSIESKDPTIRMNEVEKGGLFKKRSPIISSRMKDSSAELRRADSVIQQTFVSVRKNKMSSAGKIESPIKQRRVSTPKSLKGEVVAPDMQLILPTLDALANGQQRQLASLGDLTDFNRDVFTPYLAKSLSLEYQRTILAKDQLQAIKLLAQITEAKLDAIKINTSVPEREKEGFLRKAGRYIKAAYGIVDSMGIIDPFKAQIKEAVTTHAAQPFGKKILNPIAGYAAHRVKMSKVGRRVSAWADAAEAHTPNADNPGQYNLQFGDLPKKNPHHRPEPPEPPKPPDGGSSVRNTPGAQPTKQQHDEPKKPPVKKKEPLDTLMTWAEKGYSGVRDKLSKDGILKYIDGVVEKIPDLSETLSVKDDKPKRQHSPQVHARHARMALNKKVTNILPESVLDDIGEATRKASDLYGTAHMYAADTIGTLRDKDQRKTKLDGLTESVKTGVIEGYESLKGKVKSGYEHTKDWAQEQADSLHQKTPGPKLFGDAPEGLEGEVRSFHTSFTDWTKTQAEQFSQLIDTLHHLSVGGGGGPGSVHRPDWDTLTPWGKAKRAASNVYGFAKGTAGVVSAPVRLAGRVAGKYMDLSGSALKAGAHLGGHLIDAGATLGKYGLQAGGRIGAAFFKKENPLWSMYSTIFKTTGQVVGATSKTLGNVISSALTGKGAIGGAVKGIFGMLGPAAKMYGDLFKFGLQGAAAVGRGVIGITKRVFGFGDKGKGGTGVNRKDVYELITRRLDDIYDLLDGRLDKPIRVGSYADKMKHLADRRKDLQHVGSGEGTSSGGKGGILGVLGGLFGHGKGEGGDKKEDEGHSGGLIDTAEEMGEMSAVGWGGNKLKGWGSSLKNKFFPGKSAVGEAESGIEALAKNKGVGRQAGGLFNMLKRNKKFAIAAGLGLGAYELFKPGTAQTAKVPGAAPADDEPVDASHEALQAGAMSAGGALLRKGTASAATEAAEVASKEALETGARVAGKDALKFGAKFAAKSLVKKIPLIGLLAGIGFAAKRAFAGDWIGAGMELASGGASIVPGLGTAASIGIDAALAAKDAGAFEDANTQKTPEQIESYHRSHDELGRSVDPETHDIHKSWSEIQDIKAAKQTVAGTKASIDKARSGLSNGRPFSGEMLTRFIKWLNKEARPEGPGIAAQLEKAGKDLPDVWDKLMRDGVLGPLTTKFLDKYSSYEDIRAKKEGAPANDNADKTPGPKVLESPPGGEAKAPGPSGIAATNIDKARSGLSNGRPFTDDMIVKFMKWVDQQTDVPNASKITRRLFNAGSKRQEVWQRMIADGTLGDLPTKFLDEYSRYEDNRAKKEGAPANDNADKTPGPKILEGKPPGEEAKAPGPSSIAATNVAYTPPSGSDRSGLSNGRPFTDDMIVKFMKWVDQQTDVPNASKITRRLFNAGSKRQEVWQRMIADGTLGDLPTKFLDEYSRYEDNRAKKGAASPEQQRSGYSEPQGSNVVPFPSSTVSTWGSSLPSLGSAPGQEPTITGVSGLNKGTPIDQAIKSTIGGVSQLSTSTPISSGIPSDIGGVSSLNKGTPIKVGPQPTLGGASGSVKDTNRNALLQTMKENGITSPQEQAMFMAQMDHESGGFKKLDENLNYKPETLMKMFPKKFACLDDAKAVCAGGKEAIANKIYGGRMGNDAGEGYAFRGRGFTQLTGKANYAEAGKDLGLDLVNNPDLASDPANAAKIAAWYWKKKKVGDAAQKGDVAGATKKINGGAIGLAERQKKYDEYLAQAQAGGLNPTEAAAQASAEVAANTGTPPGPDSTAAQDSAKMAAPGTQVAMAWAPPAPTSSPIISASAPPGSAPGDAQNTVYQQAQPQPISGRSEPNHQAKMVEHLATISGHVQGIGAQSETLASIQDLLTKNLEKPNQINAPVTSMNNINHQKADGQDGDDALGINVKKDRQQQYA